MPVAVLDFSVDAIVTGFMIQRAWYVLTGALF
jgi:hypothetical protein